MSDTPADNAAPAAAPAYADIAKQLGEELKKEGIVPATAEVTGAPATPEGEEAPDSFKKGFDKLIKKQAAVRQESEEVKHAGKLAKLFSPAQASVLEQAISSRDPLAILSAAGFSYADVARQITGRNEAKAEAPKVEEKKSGLPPELQSELDELRAFRNEFKAEKMSKTETQMMTKIQEAVGDKYPYINDQEDFQGVKLMIEELYNQGKGKFPDGMQPGEVIEVCAEEYNERMSRFDKRLESGRKRLTPREEAESDGEQATRETPKSAPVASGAAKTLTNKLATPASSQTSKFNLDDVFKELASDKTLW